MLAVLQLALEHLQAAEVDFSLRELIDALQLAGHGVTLHQPGLHTCHVWFAQSTVPRICKSTIGNQLCVPWSIFGPAASEDLERRLLVPEQGNKPFMQLF